MITQKIQSNSNQTDMKSIPKDWQMVRIGDHFDFKNGLNKEKKFFGKGTPIVNYLDVYKNPGLRSEDIRGKVTVSNEELRTFEIRKGDVLFTRTSETIEDIGMSSVIVEDVTKTVFSGFLLRARPKTTLFELQFKKYCFHSSIVRRQITSSSSQTTRALTNGRLLSEVYVPVPNNPKEQLSIAETISNTEELIEKLEKIIMKKKNIKRGITQELITGKKRLSGYTDEWKELELGTIGVFSRGKGIKRSDVSDAGFPCVRYGEIYTRYNTFVEKIFSHIQPQVAAQSQRIQKGDILFAGSGETAEDIGKCVTYLGDDNAYAGGDIIIFSPAGSDSLFLSYLLNSEYVRKQKAHMAQGDAVVHIYSSALKSIIIRIPNLPEQAAISQVLSDMDAEIEELEKMRDKYIMIKNGMMQQLLTGRIRLQ